MTLSVPSFLAAATSALIPPPACADCADFQLAAGAAPPDVAPPLAALVAGALPPLLEHPAAASATAAATTPILTTLRFILAPSDLLRHNQPNKLTTRAC